MSTDVKTVQSTLKPKILSHGTLGTEDLEATRKFYTEFLGLEVVRTSPISLLVRLGTDHVYAVVQMKKKPPMTRINHNGLDFETDEEIDAAYETVLAEADKWGLHNITRPVAQHGTYSFHFVDRDENCWEILSNPPRGYTWIFEKGDLEGRGHLDREFRKDDG